MQADARVLDASGLLILPGGIDPHVHLRSSVEFAFADDLESGTRAAGGITTVGHMAFPATGGGPSLASSSTTTTSGCTKPSAT